MNKIVISTGKTTADKKHEMITELKRCCKSLTYDFLKKTDWIVQRSKDQNELNVNASLSDEKYKKILQQRQRMRELSNVFELSIASSEFDTVKILSENVFSLSPDTVPRAAVRYFLQNANQANIVQLLVDFFQSQKR